VGLKAADGCVVLLPISIKDGKGAEVGDDVVHLPDGKVVKEQNLSSRVKYGGFKQQASSGA
jgi:hypothetical protein